MSFTKKQFTKSWKTTDGVPYFPTYEDNETQVRADQQQLYDESRDMVHDLIDELNASAANTTSTKTEVDQIHSSGVVNADLVKLHAVTSSAANIDDAVSKRHNHQIGKISLSSTWTGSSSPYTQVVTVTGATVTSNSMVDIQPDSTMIAAMLADKCSALYIVNNNGTLTVYAVGGKLTTAHSNVQVCVTGVSV